MACRGNYAYSIPRPMAPFRIWRDDVLSVLHQLSYGGAWPSLAKQSCANKPPREHLRCPNLPAANRMLFRTRHAQHTTPFYALPTCCGNYFTCLQSRPSPPVQPRRQASQVLDVPRYDRNASSQQRHTRPSSDLMRLPDFTWVRLWLILHALQSRVSLHAALFTANYITPELPAYFIEPRKGTEPQGVAAHGRYPPVGVKRAHPTPLACWCGKGDTPCASSVACVRRG